MVDNPIYSTRNNIISINKQQTIDDNARSNLISTSSVISVCLLIVFFLLIVTRQTNSQ